MVQWFPGSTRRPSQSKPSFGEQLQTALINLSAGFAGAKLKDVYIDQPAADAEHTRRLQTLGTGDPTKGTFRTHRGVEAQELEKIRQKNAFLLLDRQRLDRLEGVRHNAVVDIWKSKEVRDASVIGAIFKNLGTLSREGRSYSSSVQEVRQDIDKGVNLLGAYLKTTDLAEKFGLKAGQVIFLKNEIKSLIDGMSNIKEGQIAQLIKRTSSSSNKMNWGTFNKLLERGNSLLKGLVRSKIETAKVTHMQANVINPLTGERVDITIEQKLALLGSRLNSKNAAEANLLRAEVLQRQQDKLLKKLKDTSVPGKDDRQLRLDPKATEPIKGLEPFNPESGYQGPNAVGTPRHGRTDLPPKSMIAGLVFQRLQLSESSAQMRLSKAP